MCIGVYDAGYIDPTDVCVISVVEFVATPNEIFDDATKSFPVIANCAARFPDNPVFEITLCSATVFETDIQHDNVIDPVILNDGGSPRVTVSFVPSKSNACFPSLTTQSVAGSILVSVP